MALINQASETAIAKAEMATEKRFATVNEFRANLADQTASFLPREVAEAQFKELRDRVQSVVEVINARAAARAGEKEAKEGMSSNVGLGIAVVGVVFAGLTVLITVVLAANGVL